MRSKKNIFIVDDVQENLQVIANILKEHGFNISFARNGPQALKGIGKKKPDLVILDVTMPYINGYEVCKRLKEDKETSDIPVIFLTARREADDIVKGLELGAVDYVVKPFNTEELLARIYTHIELKEARDIIKYQNEELKRINYMLEEKNRELYITSITDKLTGINSRLYIIDILSREFSKSKRHGSGLSCIMLDIDHFKGVNDTYGHIVGDFVLREIAQFIKGIIRHEDYFGRYGGEEFLLILPSISKDNAFVVAEKIRKKVQGIVLNYNRVSLSITLSIGVADAYDCEKDADIIQNADIALYQAKNSGRNKTIMFE